LKIAHWIAAATLTLALVFTSAACGGGGETGNVTPAPTATPIVTGTLKDVSDWMAVAKGQISKLQLDVAELDNADLSTLTAGLQKVSDDLVVVTNLALGHSGNLSTLQSKVDLLNLKVVSMNATAEDIELIRDDIDYLLEEVEILWDEQDYIIIDFNELWDLYDDVEVAQEDLASSMEDLWIESDELYSLYDEMAIDVDDAMDLVSSLEFEVEGLMSQIGTLPDDVANLTFDVEMLTVSVDSLGDDVNALYDLVSTTALDIESLVLDIDDLYATQDLVFDMFDEMSVYFAELWDAYDALEARITVLETTGPIVTPTPSPDPLTATITYTGVGSVSTTGTYQFDLEVYNSGATDVAGALEVTFSAFSHLTTIDLPLSDLHGAGITFSEKAVPVTGTNCISLVYTSADRTFFKGSNKWSVSFDLAYLGSAWTTWSSSAEVD